MNNSKHLALLAIITVASLSACGGGKGSSGSGSKPAANNGAAATSAESNSASTVADAVGGGQATGFAGLGMPTKLVAGGSGELSATLTGRDCAANGLFGTCRGAKGAGGEFIVSAENDPKDFSMWTVTVRCGVSPAVPVASASGKQLVATADLSFASHGEVLGISLHTEGASEAMLAFQPAGASCPTVFGLGAIQPNSIMVGGVDVVGVTRPDGSLACVTADAAGFKVAEGQTGCALG